MIEWFSHNLWALWLLAALILGIIEMFSLDFFCLMLASSSAITALSTTLTDSFTLQVVIFAIFSILLLLILRPQLVNRLHKNSPQIETNVQALIGQRAEVIENITENSGLIRLAGDIWTARTEDKTAQLPPGTHTTVESIRGATVYVRPDPNPISSTEG